MPSCPRSAPHHRWILRLWLPCLAAQVAALGSQLTIDASHPGVSVSPTLYGAFLEEINHAVDGGLYAELVRNRAFNEMAWPGNWTVSSQGGATLATGMDPSEHAGAQSSALKLTVTGIPANAAAGASSASIVNTGFWGVPLSDGATYTATVWAKTDGSYSGAIAMQLQSNSGTLLGSVAFPAPGSSWTRLTAPIQVANPRGQSDDNAVLVTLNANGTVWLQMVSLFPPTWKGRPNGVRPDLAEALAALRPSLLRFPGGAFVEGYDINSRWNWKITIGDVIDRPGHPGLWGYFSSDGMGLHEYLQLAEDLGATPVLAVWSGYSTDGLIVPQSELAPYVQDALDAIEYANGDPATSVWGAQRAANGHPAPFQLSYIEIGNEDELDNTLAAPDSYNAYRFPMFYDAIKHQYPYMHVIASYGENWLTTPVTSRQPDLEDEHFYEPTASLLTDSHKYDTRDRSGPQVFVGELAALDFNTTAPQEPARLNTLGGALGEAAFLIGLERNSDLVWGEAYAPLLVNVNNQAWLPDLIWFDASHVVPTPNYWVKWMFSRHRGDVVLPATADEASGLYASVTWRRSGRTIVMKVLNNAAVANAATIAVQGGLELNPVGRATILTAASRTGQNTFDSPNQVAPVESAVAGVGSSFPFTFPANSVTVLELKSKCVPPRARLAPELAAPCRAER